MKIFKYELRVGRNDLPVTDVKWLHVGEQEGKMCIWGLVDTTKPVKAFAMVYLFRTGEELPQYLTVRNFIGTVVCKDATVFHAFTW